MYYSERNGIIVQFYDKVGNSKHDATYVDSTISTVEFTCLCSNCTTVQLFVVDKNQSYVMEKSELSRKKEWKYKMKINSTVSLGEYKCRSNNSYFASYNWTYRALNRSNKYFLRYISELMFFCSLQLVL